MDVFGRWFVMIVMFSSIIMVSLVYSVCVMWLDVEGEKMIRSVMVVSRYVGVI